MSTAEAFDLVVIGSGPAGEKGAAQAAYFGKRVAVVERERHCGGAAANTGTLPSKTLRETSLALAGFRNRGLYGVDLSLRREATVKDFLHREEVVVGLERDRIDANLERHRVTVFRGEGSFVDPHTVRVAHATGETTVLHAEVVLVATGSCPRRLPMFPFEDPRVYDSDEILRLESMPKSMTVVGGGVIGCEYACTFAALGVRVRLVEGREPLLGFLDLEVSRALRRAMEGVGIEFVIPDAVTGCRAAEDAVHLTLASGRELSADALLVSAGRTSNTAALNLDAAGVRTGKYGVIEVDEHFRTSSPSVYAAGDVVGFPALASTSMEQARVAVVHAFDLKYKAGVSPVLPYGLYTIPEVSMAGETEETATARGVDYVVGKSFYRQNARGQIIGDEDGMLKILFALPDMRVIGVHALGEQATELVHVGLAAILAGATSDLFIRMCFNYPTLGELYKYATYDAMGKAALRDP